MLQILSKLCEFYKFEDFRFRIKLIIILKHLKNFIFIEFIIIEDFHKKFKFLKTSRFSNFEIKQKQVKQPIYNTCNIINRKMFNETLIL